MARARGERDGRKGRAMLVAILQAVAGILILLLNITFAEPVSLGSLLGVLLLVSAVARYVMQRDRSRA